MKRLLVNDMLSALPGHRTFWNDLQDWFDMEFVGGDYATLSESANAQAQNWYDRKECWMADLIVRNASWFGPIKASERVPTISLLQDIFTGGPAREMQEAVIGSSRRVVFNSEFTASKYPVGTDDPFRVRQAIIPLPVDFAVFEPGNAMGLQQALSLPDGCVLWVGASQGAAAQVKGFDTFIRIVRANPDIPFVGVFKDALPEYSPPNLRMFCRLTHEELVKVIGACRVGLCTSRMESQHLAGIEMGACGLPVIAPPVGTYWKRSDAPVILPFGGEAKDYSDVLRYSSAVRETLLRGSDTDFIRDYWRKEFDPSVIRSAWTALIEEVECTGRS